MRMYPINPSNIATTTMKNPIRTYGSKIMDDHPVSGVFVAEKHHKICPCTFDTLM